MGLSKEGKELLLLHQVINIPNFQFFIAIYQCFGLWPPNPHKSHPCRRFFYFLIAGIGHFFGTFLYFSSLVINFALQMTINDLYITLTELGMICKCTHFFRRHLQFQALTKDLLTNPIFSIRNSEEKNCYTKNLRHYKIIINFYMGICLSVIVSAGVSSIFSDPITLSYPAWFPFDATTSRNLPYFLVFFYQNIGMSIHCLINLTWDCLMPFLMVNLRTQFQLLSLRMEKGFTDPKDSQRTRTEICFWINHYNALVRLNQEIVQSIAMPIAVQIMITGVVLCIGMLQIVTMSPMDNLASFAFYVFYIVCMLIQIYLQCYFGSLASAESERALHALFCGNWLEVDNRNRKLLIMFMVRLREAIRIRTMSVFFVDRRAFLSILNMAYSLFAVLRKTNRIDKV